MSKVLVIVAHPDIAASRANKAAVAALEALPNVTVHHLYHEYPDFKIDAAREQALLLAHDAVVLQFPFFWYSSPALLKEWLDVAWSWGFAFGPNGIALQDKICKISVTMGSPETAYSPEGANTYTMEELLRPLELTARLCKMKYLAPHTIGWAKRISEEELAASVAALAAEVAAM
jgi:glutathione-regulated potassium-efflux system ancillary protein KefG